jgi:hypothetical protein
MFTTAVKFLTNYLKTHLEALNTNAQDRRTEAS